MLHASWLMCVGFVLLLCICILKLWNVKGAVVREWAGWWRLVTVFWILGKLAEKCFGFFSLLLLETHEEMFDQMQLFSQKKRIALSAAHLPWQWILSVLGRVARVFLVHPLCGCCTSAPLLRKGCAAEQGDQQLKKAEWEACCTGGCLPPPSLTLSQSLSSANYYSFPIFFSH